MANTATQTYREQIQTLIREIWKAYDECEGLRDCATLQEKDHWNFTRGRLYDAAQKLMNLDNSLSDARAAMIC